MPSHPVETTFVVGTGANVNGWKPVLDAINELSPDLDLGHDIENANTYFARHVYHRKFVARYRDVLHLAPSLEDRLKQHDLHLKRAISGRLIAASEAGEMRLRSEFLSLLRDNDWGPSVFVTANWDLLLERNGIPAESVVHVHGDVTRPGLLFLPTEITGELHHSADEVRAMRDAIERTWGCVAAARKLVLYGLSLSPLDAELGHLISMGLSEHGAAPCDVYVYNVEQEVGRVQRRAQMFLEKSAQIRFHLRPVSGCD
jgi:hypothetical protein